jgi:transposase
VERRPALGVAVGIDSRKRTLAVAAVDSVGKVTAAREFPNHRQGHMELLTWVRSLGDDRAVGVECSGSFGAAVSRALVDAGEEVAEVPANLAHREARRSQAKGKSDATDAIAIARVVARGEGLASVDRRQTWTDLKLLSDRRDRLMAERTRAINRITRLCSSSSRVTSPPPASSRASKRFPE